MLAVSEAVDRVKDEIGGDVHLGGYSQGGMFVYQVAAYRRNDGLASLITFGSPVDTRQGAPFGIPGRFAGEVAEVLTLLFRGGGVPAWFSRSGFLLLDPVKSARNRIEFLLQLHDREALLPRERQRRFLEAEGWVAWPGPALAEFVNQFVAHNRMLEGGFVIEDRLLSLADIAVPVLSVVGTVDDIAPAGGVRAIRQAAPRADVYELPLHAGHFGLVVGSLSTTVTWPTVAAWAHWRAGEGELPENVNPITDDGAVEVAPQVRTSVGYGVELAAGAGLGAARSALGVAERAVRGARGLSREAAAQLPRLARLEQIQPNTRVSLGLLIEERRLRAPRDVFFLYEDRAYEAGEVGERIDNVVQGLLSVGVRQGEHVGVLMSARPSALAAVAAINRIGAVAVLMRPDGDPRREAALGQLERVIADPERAGLTAELEGIETFVLGGGGAPRDLGIARATDMEQIDPAAVTPPRWYRPNPGRAGDLAFIVFSGEGEHTRASRITNRRWAQSAFGTASAAALGPADTVYSITPVYHPSGLMMSIGGAIAGGARLAVARRFDVSDLLGGGQALRRDGGVLHLDDARRGRRRAAAAGRATPSAAPVHRLGYAARSVAAGRGAVQSGARRRVLCFDRGGRDPRQRSRREARLDGSSLTRQRRGEDRRIRPRERGIDTRSRRVRQALRRRRGRDAARAGGPERPAQHNAAAFAVRAGRRVGRDRRPVPTRRGR